MSDTEESSFDKEAEKEKLRQQLADEEDARKTTQHMSELLLKGATMTNRHCGNCGDPLFRHEGREFCPTCGGEAAAGEARGEPADAGEGSEAAPEGGEAAVDGGATAQSAPRAGPAAGGATPQPGRAGGPPATGEADVAAAREALARTVTALAHEAEASSDVGRTRELLAAVREGAEALRALDGVGR